jgi:lantibiotic modifying enzyme
MLTVLQKAALVDIDLQEDLRELDESMAGVALKQITEEGRNDYLHGAMGVVHYFTTRSNESHIRQYIETLVKAFCNTGVSSNDGTWFPNFIADPQEKQRIDTGLSHGNAGFLLILLNVLQASILEKSLPDIITKGIQFLLAQRLEPDPESVQYGFFPFSIDKDNNEDTYLTQRLAWCYGDLNIILLLYRAAALLHQPRWKELADNFAGEICKRKDRYSTLVEDSHFCHGAAGLAQVYKALYSVSGNELFKTNATYWVERTLDLLEDEWKTDHYAGKGCDLLNGLAGINLVLLSFITSKELTWGRSLLL